MTIPPRRLARLLLLLLPFAVCAAASAAPDPAACGAELTAVLLERTESDERVEFRFRVDIVAAPGCSELSYDFMVEEMLPNKQTKTVRKPRSVALEEGKRSEVVEHSITHDLELLGYAVRLVECDCRDDSS